MPITPEQRRQIAAWLTPGRVVLLPFADKNNELKYFIVGTAFPDFDLIIINSEPRHQNALCVSCQVPMTKVDYPFFSKEVSHAHGYSLIDSIKYRDAVDALVQNPHWMKGEINDATKASIRAALSASDVISPVKLAKLLKALK